MKFSFLLRCNDLSASVSDLFKHCPDAEIDGGEITLYVEVENATLGSALDQAMATLNSLNASGTGHWELDHEYEHTNNGLTTLHSFP